MVKKNEENTVKSELSNKNLIHYEVCLNTYFQSSKEIDKTFLTLSSFSIGVLITLLDAFKTYSEMCFWFLSIVCFIITILLNLSIVFLHSEMMTSILRSENEKLKLCDENISSKRKLSCVSFSCGIIFACILVFIQNYNIIISV